VWEVVNITIRKMNKHVAKLSREAADARRMIEEALRFFFQFS